MQQIIGVAVLALICKSKNPVRDYNTLMVTTSSRRQPQIPPSAVASSAAPTAIGQTFEDTFKNVKIPHIASILRIPNNGFQFYKITNHNPHCGDGVMFYKNTIGLIELKNHRRGLSITDRRRFFDSILINAKFISWGMLVTSKCSIPGVCKRGYCVVGKLVTSESKIIPVVFVSDLDVVRVETVASVIEKLGRGGSDFEFPAGCPTWSAEELLQKGECNANLQSHWNSNINAEVFKHPSGVFFA